MFMVHVSCTAPMQVQCVLMYAVKQKINTKNTPVLNA